MVDDFEEGELMGEAENEQNLDHSEILSNESGHADNNEDDCADSEDEGLLNIEQLASAVEANTQQYDPKLCQQCHKENWKYKCPRCELRTCSLACSKEHKQVLNCDGQRGPWVPVVKLSEFNGDKSIDDQKFLKEVRNSVKKMNDGGSIIDTKEQIPTTSEMPSHLPPPLVGIRYQPDSPTEKFLLNNSLLRHIWLSFSKEKEDGSRHEQFSDTIFWTLDLEFIKELVLEDKSLSYPVVYKHRVQQIPESVRPLTVLRQFLKPRLYGCVVSKSDLDVDSLAPFIEAGIEGINVYMKVPMPGINKYYLVKKDTPLLDSLRNRIIVDHPKLIITLDTECFSFEEPTEAEYEKIREWDRTCRLMNGGLNQGFPSRGGFRGRGGWRGPPRGGFRGGRGFARGASRGSYREGGVKRSWNDPDGPGHSPEPWKRGGGRPSNAEGFSRLNHDPSQLFASAAVERAGAEYEGFQPKPYVASKVFDK